MGSLSCGSIGRKGYSQELLVFGTLHHWSVGILLIHLRKKTDLKQRLHPMVLSLSWSQVSLFGLLQVSMASHTLLNIL